MNEPATSQPGVGPYPHPNPARALVVVARVVVATAAYLGALSAAAVLAYLIGLAIVPPAAQGPFALISLGAVEGAALGAVLLVWRLVDRRPLRDLGLNPSASRRRWMRGAAVAAAMMVCVVLVWYTLVDGAAWNVNPDAARATVVVLAGLFGFVVQGASEEVLFRGYMFENLAAKWGDWWAVGVSSLAFALLHAFNPHFGPLPVINLVLFGVATALYKMAVDAGQLWGVFGMHSLWNWLQQVVFGLPNSGGEPVADNSLFTISPNTSLPEPIWGGGFGPEGTLGASLALLVLIGLTLRRRAMLQSTGQRPIRRAE